MENIPNQDFLNDDLVHDLQLYFLDLNFSFIFIYIYILYIDHSYYNYYCNYYCYYYVN